MYRPQANNSLEQISEDDIFYSIDNLSEDSDGTIFAAIHPKGIDILKQTEDPLGINPPSTVVRIYRLEGGGYTWEKILEDRDGEILPGSTTVVHDAKTGRLFLSGKCPLLSLFATR